MSRPRKTQTYDERRALGLHPVFVWLTAPAFARLEALASQLGGKTAAVESLLTEAHRAIEPDPEPAHVPPPALKRREEAPRLGTAAALAERVRSVSPRRTAVVVSTGKISTDGR